MTDFDRWIEEEGLTFEQALRRLAAQVGVTLPPADPTTSEHTPQQPTEDQPCMPQLSESDREKIKVWLIAHDRGDTRGIKVPWVFIRREIAKRWCVPPWVVDDHEDEAQIEMAILKIETEVAARTI